MGKNRKIFIKLRAVHDIAVLRFDDVIGGPKTPADLIFLQGGPLHPKKTFKTLNKDLFNERAHTSELKS